MHYKREVSAQLFGKVPSFVLMTKRGVRAPDEPPKAEAEERGWSEASEEESEEGLPTLEGVMRG